MSDACKKRSTNYAGEEARSYQIIIPYLERFLLENAGRIVDYKRDDKNEIEQCFVCPSIMNDKL